MQDVEIVADKLHASPDLVAFGQFTGCHDLFNVLRWAQMMELQGDEKGKPTVSQIISIELTLVKSINGLLQ
jgi:hypothetical protein